MANERESSLLSRRRFVGSALAAGSLPAVGLGQTSSLKPGTVILFQGDSITDAGRDRKRGDANDARGFGRGYPFLIASHLLNARAGDDLKIYNRGISGNKVPDLDARW